MELSPNRKTVARLSEWLACLDHCPEEHANPWFKLIRRSRETHGIDWRGVADAVEAYFQGRFGASEGVPMEDTLVTQVWRFPRPEKTSGQTEK